MHNALVFILFIFGTEVALSNKIPKYFAIDVDRTFYIADQTKFARNIESFYNLRKAYIVGLFCTGRSRSSTMDLVGQDFVNRTGYNGFPGIYSNGAIVYDYDGTVISHSHFTEEFLMAFIKYVVDNSLDDAAMFGEGDSFYKLKDLRDEFKPKWCNNTTTLLSTADEIVKKKIVTISLIQQPDIKELEGQYVSKKSTRGTLVYITPKGTTKAEGLAKFLNHHKISADECAFIGDGDNDIEAMKMCKLSYAVDDANAEVKSAAKTVLTKKYDEGAFEEAVNSFIALITEPRAAEAPAPSTEC